MGFIHFYPNSFFLTVDSSWIDFAFRCAAETVCGVCIVLQRQSAVCVLCCRDSLPCVYCSVCAFELLHCQLEAQLSDSGWDTAHAAAHPQYRQYRARGHRHPLLVLKIFSTYIC